MGDQTEQKMGEKEKKGETKEEPLCNIWLLIDKKGHLLYMCT